MKNLILVGMMVAQTGTAFAQSHCARVQEAYEGDEMSLFGKRIDLKVAYENEYVTELPGITKQQLVIAVKTLYGDYLEEPINSATQAAKHLVEGSEGSEAYIYHFKTPAGLKVTEITSYPGGNEVGAIFDYGTRHMIASINDGDFNCR